MFFTKICSIVQQWQKGMEEKLSPLFSLKEVLSEDEATKMGRKDPEEEVEKFVSANTQELGKDKWLCPLSGKKFKVRYQCLWYRKSGAEDHLFTHLHFLFKGPRVCTEAHLKQTRGQDRRSEKRGGFLQ